MNSITKKSMLLLSSVSLLVMVIVFSTSYIFAHNYLDKLLDKEIEDSQTTLAIVLQEPIFSYDKELIGNILGAFVARPHIHKISAYDHRDKLLFEQTENEKQPQGTEVISKEVPIIWSDGATIGKLKITFRGDSNDTILSAVKGSFCIIALILLLVLQLTNWLALSKLVVKPLRTVGDALSVIASGGGDLTSRLTIKSNDEIGRLAGDFNHFIIQLHAIVSSVVEAANEVNKTSNAIISSASKNVEATQKQLQETEQASTALHEMSLTTNEIAENANHTAKNTEICSKLAQTGTDVVNDTVKQIDLLGGETRVTRLHRY